MAVGDMYCMHESVSYLLHVNTVGEVFYVFMPGVFTYVRCVFASIKWMYEFTGIPRCFFPAGGGRYFFSLPFMSINTCLHKKHICLYAGSV